MDTGVRPTFSPPTPLPSVCGLLAVIEKQQGVIDQQKTRLEQLQLHINELCATHECQLQTLQEQQTQIDALKDLQSSQRLFNQVLITTKIVTTKSTGLSGDRILENVRERDALIKANEAESFSKPSIV